MKVEFNDIKIGDNVSIEMPVFYWLELLTWAETVVSSSKFTSCTALDYINTEMWEKITTEAFRKAQLAEMHERHENHPLVQVIRQFRRDDDGGEVFPA